MYGSSDREGRIMSCATSSAISVVDFGWNRSSKAASNAARIDLASASGLPAMGAPSAHPRCRIAGATNSSA